MVKYWLIVLMSIKDKNDTTTISYFQETTNKHPLLRLREINEKGKNCFLINQVEVDEQTYNLWRQK